MSGRPQGWSAVGWDRDPTPGDPDAVAELATRFRRTAEAVRTAADGLKSIRSSDTYKGEGGKELRERTRDLAGKVKEVEERYAEAAEALDAYHPEQYAAQRLADDALRRAIEAQSQQNSAASTLFSFPAAPVDGTVEDPTLTQARGAALRAGDEAKAALGQAEQDVRTAHQWQQEAAERAARKLRNVIKDDGLSDSRWDDFKGNSIAVVKGLAKVMDVIATVAGVLALVLAWVPVVGQVLALVALVATAISFVAHFTLLVTGNEGFLDTLLAAFALLTFGLGRVATSGGRAAVRLSRARAGAAASSRNMPKRVPRQLSRRPMTKKVWANRSIGGKLTPAEKEFGRTMKGKPLPGYIATTRESLSRKAVTRDLVAGRREFWTTLKSQRPSWTAFRQEVVTPWRPTFKPLDDIDPKLLASPEVRHTADVANVYRRAAQVSTGADRLGTGYGAYKTIKGEEELVAAANLPPLEGSEAEQERQRLQEARDQALVGIGFRQHVITVDRDREGVPAGPPYVDASARP